jgi:hypothetical protein
VSRLNYIESKAKYNGRDNAFPNEMSCGLTKREWFAGKAMEGLLASPGNTTLDTCVDYAIIAADSMLRKLAETEAKHESS